MAQNLPTPPADHVHAWSPLPMETGKYVCECGTFGFRTKKMDIQPYKSQDAASRAIGSHGSFMATRERGFNPGTLKDE